MTTPSKVKRQRSALPDTCLRWSFDGSRARAKSDGAWVKHRDYEEMRDFANGRMCAAESLETELQDTKRALELCVTWYSNSDKARERMIDYYMERARKERLGQ